MNSHRAWLPILVLALGACETFGQDAVAVQLPTYSMFSTNTTVSVPDRGNVYMGGVNRAASGRNEFGVPLLPFRPFRNTGIGMERSASNVRVSAYIHDFDAMDEYLLSRPTASYPNGLAAGASYGPRSPVGSTPSLAGTVPPRTLDARALGHTLLPRGQGGRTETADAWRARVDVAQAGSAGPASMSVAQLRVQHQAEQQERQQEAETFFQRGQNAEAAGKLNVARIYYQQAERRATGQLKDQINARLRLVTGANLAQGDR